MIERRYRYDVVHVVHGTYPDDPRVRREATVAADVAGRVAVIALRQANRSNAGHHGRIRVVRLTGAKSRGSALDYVREYAVFTIRVFLLFLRDQRFQRARIVHVHTLPDFLIFGALPAIRGGSRTILDLHEIFPEFIRSRFRGPAGAAASLLARALERASRARATVTITVNTPIRDLLARRPARRGERIVVVHNVADPRDMGSPAPRAYALGDPTRLVYHGTLTALYGVDIAIAAIAKSRAAGATVTLDIFGDGPSRSALEALSARLGVTGAVRFHGNVSHTRLRTDLPAFDGGLIPTRLDAMTHYSLSTKLLELFHLGIPVIAARIPTYRAYFPDDCAWYFTPGDVTSAASTIGQFVRATEGARRSRAEAARTVTGRLGWPAEAARLASVYRELLGGRAMPESPAHQPQTPR